MNPKDGKAEFLPAAVFAQGTRPRKFNWRALALAALLASVLIAALHYVDLPSGLFLSAIRLDHHGEAKLCPQSSALYPKHHAEVWKTLGREFDEKTFTTRAVAWLGGAVRIPYV
jgi:hypothetical protein